MKKFSATITIFLFLTLFFGDTSLSWGDDELTDEQKLACEAILCLSTGTPPSECDAALDYFYSIKRKKPSDTRDARKSFLKKCPDSDAEGMPSLVDAIVNYSCSSCTVEKLNRNLIKVQILAPARTKRYGEKYIVKSTTMVDPKLPAYCQQYYNALANHEYTDYPQLNYIGLDIGQRVKDDDGNEYYLIYSKSRNEQAQIAETISENHWEWAD